MLMEGNHSGGHFSGKTKIAYMARDHSGNTATCFFFVFVKGTKICSNKLPLLLIFRLYFKKIQ